MRALVLLLLALSAHAQAVYQIRGTVLDTFGAPIANASIGLSGMNMPNQTLTTDATGSFQVTLNGPGPYFALASKPGYLIPQGGLGPSAINLTSAEPRKEVVIRLTRTSEISGRLLDDETREPIANGRVFLLRRRWNRGRMLLELGQFPSDAKTDANGIFRFSGLQPGVEYILSPRGFPNSAELLVPDFHADDLKKTDEGYEISYWPGGTTDAASVIALPTEPGGSVNAGNVYARKVKQYRARVTLGACEGSVRLLLHDSRIAKTSPLGVFPCGSQILLRGLDSRGSQTLYATPNPSNARGIPDTLYWGQSFLPITDRNVELRLPVRPGSIAEGVLTFPKGSPPQTVPQIQFVSTQIADDFQPEPFIQWEPDQLHFKIAIPSESRMLDIRPFGGLHYVKEIRINGAPGSVYSLSMAKGAQRIEIVLDDQFAALNVTVMDGSRPVPGVRVVVLQGPDLLPTGTTGASGQATISRLQPGAHRFLAIPADQLGLLDQPRVLDRVRASGTTVTLKPGETQQIQMRVTDLR